LSKDHKSDDDGTKTPPPEGTRQNKKKNRNKTRAESKDTMETFKKKNKELVSAAEEVAQVLPSASATQLLSRLYSHMDRSTDDSQPQVNLATQPAEDTIPKKTEKSSSQVNNLLSSLKVVSSKEDKQKDFGEMKKEFGIQSKRPKRTGFKESSQKIEFSLTDAPRLNIFDAEKVKKAVQNGEHITKPLGMGLFEQRREDHLKIALGGLQNAFEEQIELTKQGKLWHFPVNNEQYMHEERKYGFHEHIFLERHLAGRFPDTGPVRRFMELVCVGLGQNSWVTVPEKLKLIQWYSDYFKEKQDILERELGEVGKMPEEVEKLI